MSSPLVVFATFVLMFSSCKQKSSCTQLDKQFSSYEDAKSKIANSFFKIQDQVNTERSSWIKGASFYSCDGELGYLLLKTKDKVYLYSDVPYRVWNDFKIARSLGAFYNRNIKHKYSTQLK